MGATHSTFEEDKGLQLCRARKKFIKQALNGRCSLAAAHITYVEELKIIGTALRRFVELDSRVETFIHPTISALTERSNSVSSRSLAQHVDENGNVSPSPSPTVSTRYQSPHMKFRSSFFKKVEKKPSTPVPVSVVTDTPPNPTHHMKFRSPFSKKVEERPSTPVAVSVVTNTPPSTTPRSTEAREASYFETPSIPSDIPPWDYFGLFHPIDEHFASREINGLDHGPDHGSDHGSGFSDEIRHLNEEEEVPELENVGDKISNVGMEESEDEFDEPSTATLVRSFKNLTTSMENIGVDDLSKPFSNTGLETKVSASLNDNEVKDDKTSGNSPVGSAENIILETKSVNGKKYKSPELSPLRATSSRFSQGVKITPMKETEEVEEEVVAPKDFVSSMKEIERLFIKASDSGKEVPRMLEANKFHFRQVIPGREGGLIASSLFRSCFSCGGDPSAIQKEPQQNSVTYLTWHRTTSSRSASSRNLLGASSSVEDIEDTSNNLFDSFCMASGSHASTLDRLHAWEKKLYDEVKAGQILKSNFDARCKLLRQQESQGERENADKTRAVVKDLYSRIKVAIHRIDSISKQIEDIRDKELQPQLEELIEGLKRMWEMMLECHKLQLHIISISQSPGSTRMTMQSDTRRQLTMHLANELHAFQSSFTKWIEAQKLYVESIDKWLFKCVLLQQKKTKRNKRMKPPAIRDLGPPIYMLCGAWLEIIEELSSKAITESIKDLSHEVSHFLPHQEKNHGKTGKSHGDPNLLRDGASEDRVPALDRFRTSLTGFLGQLNNFAEASVAKLTALQRAVQERKIGYEQFKSEQQRKGSAQVM